MVTKTELLPNNEGFVVSEANGRRSREARMIAGSAVIRAGSVLEVSGNNLVPFVGGTAVAVLLSEVDATSAPVEGAVIVRDAEIRRPDLVFLNSQNEAARDSAIVDLLTVGIVTRYGPPAVAISTQQT